MIRKNVVLIILLWLSSGLFAQEIITGLHSNPVLTSNKHNLKFQSTNQKVLIHLPFLDDFSYKNPIYPAPRLWSDRNAFINSTYCINPPTIGVATLDAINDTGAVYPYATPTPFQADFLTSWPIRLDTLFNGSPTPINVGDSLYFSFFYQPQGVGNNPNPGDSLILDFFSPDSNRWVKVWGSAGLSYASFRSLYKWDFRQVMIPITQPQFLKTRFKFRFRNYASIAPLSIPSWQSNMDEWNIDYVYLNTQRTKNDTVYHDITFVDPAPTILKNFTQIPARHFVNADLKDHLSLKESNLFDNLDNISYEYDVKQENGPFTSTYLGGVGDLLPFKTNGYNTYGLQANPVVNFILPSFGGSDSVVFDITHILHSNGYTESILKNDTIVHRQEFYNSYAYDDGSAEVGYGLSGASAKLAYEFTINQPDTLGGIGMYFNQTLSNPYSKFFYLMVWSSLNPETLIYKSPRVRPIISDSLNKFVTFQIDNATVLVSGKFYVGWMQTTDDNLNVGFDRNTDSQLHTFFNVDGNWSPSAISGSLMIRPMMGTSWQTRQLSIFPSSGKFICDVYPNPVNIDKITIGLPSNYNNEDNKKNITLEIYDYLGRTVYSNLFSDELDITFLSKGIYYLRFSNYHTNEVATNKLVITR